MKKTRLRRTQVLFFPDWRSENPYQSLLADSIRRQGCDVSFCPGTSAPFALQALRKSSSRVDVVHLHWINDLAKPLLWSKTPLLRELRLGTLALDILLLRLRGIRVVWTIHNLFSHECRDLVLEKRVRRMIARTVNRVILHSSSALKLVEKEYGIGLAQKASVIPHGNYIDAYTPKENHNSKERISNGSKQRLVLMFFGMVRRYKGVMGLIRAFRETKRADLQLVIAGSCDNSQLQQEILSAARDDSRITPVLRFIPDDEVARLFRQCDAVVLPFERVLTSGSAILAMSLSKAVLLPEIANVLDLGDDSGAMYFPGLSALPGFLDSLDKDDLRRMGALNQSLMEDRGWTDIGVKTVAAYGV